jgi:hypothetical protein
MVRFLAVLLAVSMLAGGAPGQDRKASDYSQGWAWSGIASTTLEHQSKPAPTPDKTPGSVCPSCNGSGKVGDGRIFKTCLDCKGTGVVQSASLLPSMICPDGRCDLPARPSPQSPAPKPVPAAALPASEVKPQMVCEGGKCYLPAKAYQPQPQYRSTTSPRKSWFFRR